MCVCVCVCVYVCVCVCVCVRARELKTPSTKQGSSYTRYGQFVLKSMQKERNVCVSAQLTLSK